MHQLLKNTGSDSCRLSSCNATAGSKRFDIRAETVEDLAKEQD